ncbi:MAG: stage V sporulation protein SpoVM [Oscillospiraceae bacterium]|nr:stage V sporulation protein SpoVM [Oscillospiraceae bacterium]
MKIVVVKSPKILSGIFRIIFRIKRQQPEEV